MNDKKDSKRTWEQVRDEKIVVQEKIFDIQDKKRKITNLELEIDTRYSNSTLLLNELLYYNLSYKDEINRQTTLEQLQHTSDLLVSIIEKNKKLLQKEERAFEEKLKNLEREHKLIHLEEEKSRRKNYGY